MSDAKKQRIAKNNEMRLSRAKAWMNRAQVSDKSIEEYPMNDTIDDSAVRFVFWWIAFEALFKQNTGKDRDELRVFIREIKEQGNEESLQEILDNHEEAAQDIIYLRQTHEDFWSNKSPSYKDAESEQEVIENIQKWREVFDKNMLDYKKGAILVKLQILFDRLRVVRNQIFHGANSRHESRGLTQTRRGAKILSGFVPHFLKVMEDCIEFDWGDVPFPRVGEKRDEQEDVLPVWANKKANQ